jgi:hypothetical protein
MAHPMDQGADEGGADENAASNFAEVRARTRRIAPCACPPSPANSRRVRSSARTRRRSQVRARGAGLPAEGFVSVATCRTTWAMSSSPHRRRSSAVGAEPESEAVQKNIAQSLAEAMPSAHKEAAEAPPLEAAPSETAEVAEVEEAAAETHEAADPKAPVSAAELDAPASTEAASTEADDSDALAAEPSAPAQTEDHAAESEAPSRIRRTTRRTSMLPVVEGRTSMAVVAAPPAARANKRSAQGAAGSSEEGESVAEPTPSDVFADAERAGRGKSRRVSFAGSLVSTTHEVMVKKLDRGSSRGELSVDAPTSPLKLRNPSRRRSLPAMPTPVREVVAESDAQASRRGGFCGACRGGCR